MDDNGSFDVDENDHDFDTTHYHSNQRYHNNRNTGNERNNHIPYYSFNNNRRRDTPSLHTSQDSISPDPASPSRTSSRRNQTRIDNGGDNQVRIPISGREPASATYKIKIRQQ